MKKISAILCLLSLLSLPPAHAEDVNRVPKYIKTLAVAPVAITEGELLKKLNQPPPRYVNKYRGLFEVGEPMEYTNPLPIQLSDTTANLSVGHTISKTLSAKTELRLSEIESKTCTPEPQLRALFKPNEVDSVGTLLYREPWLNARITFKRYKLSPDKDSGQNYQAYLYFDKATTCLVQIRLFKQQNAK